MPQLNVSSDRANGAESRQSSDARCPSMEGQVSHTFRHGTAGRSLYRAEEIALTEIDAVLAQQRVRHRYMKEEIG
jgi:hypothetical protein